MRKSHYTAGDLRDIKFNPSVGEGLEKMPAYWSAYCGDKYFLIVFVSNVVNKKWCDLSVHTVDEKGRVSFGCKRYEFDKKNIPYEFRVVAEILRKKAAPHGGKRRGSGRKADPNSEPKKTRSFRLTDAEYEKVVAYIESLRNDVD